MRLLILNDIGMYSIYDLLMGESVIFKWNYTNYNIILFIVQILIFYSKTDQMKE